MYNTLAPHIQDAIISFIPIIVAITLHEAAHGYVAMKLGDLTAYEAGRVTFNPLKHLDLVGTILIPCLLIIMHSPFLIGYAKPVPVNASRLQHPKSGMGFVAAAGPGMNFLIALLSALGLKLSLVFEPSVYDFFGRFFTHMILINLFLGFFNLLPILPLDGGRILSSCLPSTWENAFAKHEPYGMIIVFGLVLVLPLIIKINLIGQGLGKLTQETALWMFKLIGI